MSNARQLNLLIFGIAYFFFMQFLAETTPVITGVISVLTFITLVIPESGGEPK